MADFQGIIRVAGKDLKGELTIARALYKIKGIGANLASSMANILEKKHGIPINEKIGNMNPQQIKVIEDIIFNPDKFGLPGFILDRQKDPTEGKTKHLVMSDRDFSVTQDIQNEKEMRSYRGIRHMFGHKCRGQRTKNRGKQIGKGKALGVIRAKVLPGKGAPAADEKGRKGGKKEKK